MFYESQQIVTRPRHGRIQHHPPQTQDARSQVSRKALPPAAPVEGVDALSVLVQEMTDRHELKILLPGIESILKIA